CTAIVVSHRFSTVRRADRIVVIADGKVAEDGSHAELHAAGGIYATLFDLQASRFREGTEAGELGDEKGVALSARSPSSAPRRGAGSACSGVWSARPTGSSP